MEGEHTNEKTTLGRWLSGTDFQCIIKLISTNINIEFQLKKRGFE